jgi:hypothetical protein
MDFFLFSIFTEKVSKLLLEEHCARALQTKPEKMTKPVKNHGSSPKWLAVEADKYTRLIARET